MGRKRKSAVGGVGETWAQVRWLTAVSEERDREEQEVLSAGTVPIYAYIHFCMPAWSTSFHRSSSADSAATRSLRLVQRPQQAQAGSHTPDGLNQNGENSLVSAVLLFQFDTLLRAQL